jgi:cytochrome c
MKPIVLLFICVFCISCKQESNEPFGKSVAKTPADLGKELFEGKGNCIACHLQDRKIIGPSIQDIAKAYTAQNGSIVSFLKEEAKPIIDPSQYEVMKVNLAITKAMTDAERQALEQYIYSQGL